MNDRTLFRTGIAGAAVAAVCCFTPVLVLVFGAFGLSAALGWIDFVLLPVLVICLAVATFAYGRLRRSAGTG